MNKIKLLYIVFIVYILFIFIPINLIIYFPNLAPFKMPFLASTDTVEVEKSLVLDDEDIITEDNPPSSLSPEDLNNNESAFNKFVDTQEVSPETSIKNTGSSGYVMGFFDECVTDDCTQVLLRAAPLSTNPNLTSEQFDFLESTDLFCVSKSMAKSVVYFYIEDDMYTTVPLSSRASVLSSYGTENPVQFEIIDGSMKWMSIYLDDCSSVE